ncbi:MAG: tRNA (guanosine(37)-N1)-methyltransferase TrmD [Eubacteriales bacterium]
MKFSCLTIFPEIFDCFFNMSIAKRAIDAKAFSMQVYNIRDYTIDKHKRTDDYPFGGGAGMIMTAQPIFDCFSDVENNQVGEKINIYMSPKGKILDTKTAKDLAEYDYINILCGHYEGVDQRVIDSLIDEEVSVGDYILTGGELPALVLIDTVMRFIKGVLGNEVSSEDESFSNGLLEYPQYTRPAEFRGLSVPEVLLSGHHENIEIWKRQMSILETFKKRPELLKSAKLSEDDIKFLNLIKAQK